MGKWAAKWGQVGCPGQGASASPALPGVGLCQGLAQPVECLAALVWHLGLCLPALPAAHPEPHCGLPRDLGKGCLAEAPGWAVEAPSGSCPVTPELEGPGGRVAGS